MNAIAPGPTETDVLASAGLSSDTVTQILTIDGGLELS